MNRFRFFYPLAGLLILFLSLPGCDESSSPLTPGPPEAPNPGVVVLSTGTGLTEITMGLSGNLLPDGGVFLHRLDQGVDSGQLWMMWGEADGDFTAELSLTTYYYGVLPLDDGSVVVNLTHVVSDTGDYPLYDSRLTRLTQTGDTLWQRDAGGYGYDADDGNLLITEYWRGEENEYGWAESYTRLIHATRDNEELLAWDMEGALTMREALCSGGTVSGVADLLFTGSGLPQYIETRLTLIDFDRQEVLFAELPQSVYSSDIETVAALPGGGWITAGREVDIPVPLTMIQVSRYSSNLIEEQVVDLEYGLSPTTEEIVSTPDGGAWLLVGQKATDTLHGHAELLLLRLDATLAVVHEITLPVGGDNTPMLALDMRGYDDGSVTALVAVADAGAPQMLLVTVGPNGETGL